MEKGTLLVGRSSRANDKFIMLLVHAQKRYPLQLSRELTEDELRKRLADDFGESDLQIEARIKLANEHPPI